MKAEILAVGTELLLGNIVNTNAQYLSTRLAELGIDVYHQTVVGDNECRLLDAYKQAFERADLVITTGGLGPTKDDITKEIAFDYFGKKSVLHEESLKRIKDYFKSIDKEMVESNKKQAYFPKDAIILKNNKGTAPGCILEENNKVLIVLPGPPREMTAMFEESVVPYLMKYQDGVLVSKVLRISGIGESYAAEMIEDIIDNGQNPTVATYAKDNEVTIRITAKSKDEEEGNIIIEPIEKEIRKRLRLAVYGEGEELLEEVVAKLLLQKNLTIATAESCTGGLLAGKLINYPGVSSIFKEGVVTYSNEAKMKRIKVKKDTLEKFGAVSSQVAAEMAEGVAKTSNCEIGLATTGIAGPGGGTDEKPVGLVYLGLYIRGEVKTKEIHLNGSRQRVRDAAVVRALDWLRIEIIKNSK